MSATTTVAKTNSAAMAADTRTPPNQSLYIQNLPEKLQKPDLQRALYMLFSTYGPVLDVTAVKSSKMRGQAHILFRDIHAATQAMRACQGFDFFGREMKISYAVSKSKTLAKMTGTYDPPLQPGAPEQNTVPANNTLLPPPGLGAPIPPPGVSAGPPGVAAGPPGGAAGPPGMAGPPPGVGGPPGANGGGLKAPPANATDAPSPQGVKRKAEDSDGEDAPMEGSDSEGEMDMSDDD